MRTRRDLNEIICDSKICRITIYRGVSEQTEYCKTIIDKKFYNKVRSFKWRLIQYNRKTRKVDYIYNTKNRLFLHHLILGKPSNGLMVDHINGDTLNNLKSNLRFVTPSQNLMNTNRRKGYSWNKQRCKWKAYINKGHKNYTLGYFDKEVDAKQARKKAEVKYFGKYKRNDT